MFGTEKIMKSIGRRYKKILLGRCEAYVHGHKENFQKIQFRFYKYCNKEAHLIPFSHHQYRESFTFRAPEQVAKMTQLWLRSSFHDSSYGALGFHECDSGSGSRAFLFHVSGFCTFSHIKILNVLVCLNLNGKWLYTHTKPRTQPIPNFLNNLISKLFPSSTLNMRKSEKNNNLSFRQLLAET